MIKVTDVRGRKHYLIIDVILSVHEAPSSSGHAGINSIIRTSDGKLYELQTKAEDVVQQINNEHAARISSGSAPR
jgi:uncharacterized protein YlzI (FlbEa/FlbD family)